MSGKGTCSKGKLITTGGERRAAFDRSYGVKKETARKKKGSGQRKGAPPKKIPKRSPALEFPELVLFDLVKDIAELEFQDRKIRIERYSEPIFSKLKNPKKKIPRGKGGAEAYPINLEDPEEVARYAEELKKRLDYENVVYNSLTEDMIKYVSLKLFERLRQIIKSGVNHMLKDGRIKFTADDFRRGSKYYYFAQMPSLDYTDGPEPAITPKFVPVSSIVNNSKPDESDSSDSDSDVELPIPCLFSIPKDSEDVPVFSAPVTTQFTMVSVPLDAYLLENLELK